MENALSTGRLAYSHLVEEADSFIIAVPTSIHEDENGSYYMTTGNMGEP